MPIALNYKFSGVVKDSAGVPVARTIRAHYRDSGAPVNSTTSDPVTGVFELPVDNFPFYVVVLGEAGENALIFDSVTPVL